MGNSVNFPAIKYDYYLKDTWVLTAFYKPNLTARKNSEEIFSNLNGFKKQTNYSFYSQNIVLGIEKHFFKLHKIDPFLGLSIGYSLSIKEKIRDIFEYEIPNGSLSYSEQIISSPISHGFSGLINLGLNYFLLPNFSIGMQVDLGNGITIKKGESVDYQKIGLKDNQGNILSENISELKTSYNNMYYSLNYGVAIKTAFYFAKKIK